MKRASKAPKGFPSLVNASGQILRPSGRHNQSTKVSDSHVNLEILSKYFEAERNKTEPKAERKPKKRGTLEVKYDEDAKRGRKPADDEDTKGSGKPVDDEDAKGSKKPADDAGEWRPDCWRETLALIREMRKDGTAPVDEMGCHTCADPDASPPVSRFQCLVALMLSSQTKDQVTHAAMQRLKTHGCDPENIIRTPEDVLGKLIHPVGFWKRKAEYIKRTSEILMKDYKGDIPRTIEGLCSLPGVGPKMGHICMQVAWNETSGIGVDTHVHRICNRIGWVRRTTKTPEGTREELESWLPKELWKELNHLLVGFGQETCLPRSPKCGECLNKTFCPYAKANRKN